MRLFIEVRLQCNRHHHRSLHSLGHVVVVPTRPQFGVSVAMTTPVLRAYPSHRALVTSNPGRFVTLTRGHRRHDVTLVCSRRRWKSSVAERDAECQTLSWPSVSSLVIPSLTSLPSSRLRRILMHQKNLDSAAANNC